MATDDPLPQVIKVVVPAPAPVLQVRTAEPKVINVVSTGPQGPEGERGPAGTDPDMPDLTLLFENGLV